VIIIDTNVVSALMMDSPDRKVIEWLDQAPAGSVWTTAITVFEIFFGLELLGSSRRRRSLEAAFKDFIDEDLNGRVLHFDTPSALSAASISAGLRARGQPVEVRDVQIMGIAAARRAAVATRNVRHFLDSGLPVIDPWAA
jgi:predicted nucleic acid-binding protein